MNTTRVAPQPAAARQPDRRRRRSLVASSVLQVFAMIGIGLLLYPQAADWVNGLGHNAEISGYIQQVENTPGQEQQRILDAAYTYNDQIEPGPLTDPYLSETEDAALGSDVYQAYENMLRISGTEAIGTVHYPKVNIALPIYHGTTDEVLSKGAGHMYGTSLPVGGPSTRSVLTAHSGLPHTKLFTDLHDAQVGDTFWISVLGEDHHYQVRELETVLPNQTESFQVIEDEDWVTLFTCTPVGVNSHRLLVHAQRIPDPQDVNNTIAGDGVTTGFPWWALWFVAGSGAVAWVLFAPVKQRKTTS